MNKPTAILLSALLLCGFTLNLGGTHVKDETGSLQNALIPSTEPIYSTDKCTSGTAISKGENATYDETDDAAFDDDTATKWLEFETDGYPLWIGYDFGSGNAWKIAKYTLTTANDHDDRDPKTWTVEASNTGAWTGEEVTVDTVTDGALPTERFTQKEFICDSPPSTAYRYYRILITAVKDTSVATCT